jgi:membrane-associated phospholipid phosphatase
VSRRTIFLGAFVLAGAVGASRIYLGMHFPTDVLGGFAAGVAWVAICVIGTRIARDTPAANVEAVDAERAPRA